MNRKRIIAFLFTVVIFAALLSGCKTISKEQAEDSKNEAPKTEEKNDESVKASENNSLPDDKKPNKEDLLKDMLDIPMEDFEAVDLEGNKHKLSDYKGKIIFLNFWGTWCPPCRKEMPYMQEIHDDYKDQDVVILAVSPTSVELRGGNDSKKAESKVKKFIEDSGYTFPVLLDKENEAWSLYQQRGIPTT